jgi:hypothetical protein
MDQFSWPVTVSVGPALSRNFLSADDAARHAHEQVGQRRERCYASCIFQRSDGRFVVSEPVAMTQGTLDNRLLYGKDAQGKPQLPKEHTLHSLFYSHVALSMLDVQTVAERRWNRDDAATSLFMFSVEQLRFLLDEQITAYVSGAEDSLLMFKPDAEKMASLREQLGTEQLPGPLAESLKSGALKPGRLVTQAAAAGTLEVVVSNGKWRPRGTLPAHTIVAHSWERTVPERVAYGAIFSSADEAAQDCYLRDTASHDQDRTWFGFILKQKGEAHYIATELVPVNGDRDVLYALASLFPAGNVARGYRFPESFAIHSYFYARPRVRHAEGTSKNWLADNFIVPQDLYLSVYYSKKYPQVETGASLSTYIAPKDGSLLKYTPRANTRLFDNDMPLLGLETIQANLASGKVTPTDFVRVVANSGELSVLRTSLCWDRNGPIDRYWFPGRHFQRLALGPAFVSADDAAIHARQHLPSAVGRAFGGLILRRVDGLFVATVPIAVFEEDFSIDFIFPDSSVSQGAFPEGCTIVGRYRSRVARELPILLNAGDKQVYLNMLSTEVVCSSFLWESKRLDEYLFCPDGAIIRYRANAGDQFVTGLLAKVGLDSFNGLRPAPIKRKIYEGWLLPRDWVNKLLGSGKLDVVVGSKLWGASGPVSKFTPFPPVIANAEATRDPVCGPVFAQEAAAAGYVHEQGERGGALQFGAILGDSRRHRYLANLPVVVEDENLALTKIFAQGSMPARFALQALYLYAPAHSAGIADHDYRHFFSPLDVCRAHALVNSAQGFKPIYFSCADGALLRYEMAPFDPDLPLDNFGQIKLVANPFASMARAQDDWQRVLKGSFELQRYIRRMARAGKLEVLVPSAFWSRRGEVGSDWAPRMKDLSPDEHWANKPELALGPIFHHADDAARHAQFRAGSAYEQQTVYESAILSSTGTPAYVALEPLAEDDSLRSLARIFRTMKDSDTTVRNKPPRFPDGYTLIAGHQLYASGNSTLSADPEKVYANYASPAMVFAHTFALKGKGFDIKSHYYSTPHGALIKYTPYYSEAERLLLSTPAVEFVGGQWKTVLSPGAFISQLSNIGDLRVLKAAYYWNQEGRLGADWRASRQQGPAKSYRTSRDEL